MEPLGYAEPGLKNPGPDNVDRSTSVKQKSDFDHRNDEGVDGGGG